MRRLILTHRSAVKDSISRKYAIFWVLSITMVVSLMLVCYLVFGRWLDEENDNEQENDY